MANQTEKRPYQLSEAEWEQLEATMKRIFHPNSITDNLRIFIEASFYMAYTGTPWRDLPAAYGHWNSVFNRFNNWAKYGKWALLFEQIKQNIQEGTLQDEQGVFEHLEWVSLDASIVRTHQDASRQKKQKKAPLGEVEAV
jgi:transposase